MLSNFQPINDTSIDLCKRVPGKRISHETSSVGCLNYHNAFDIANLDSINVKTQKTSEKDTKTD